MKKQKVVYSQQIQWKSRIKKRLKQKEKVDVTFKIVQFLSFSSNIIKINQCQRLYEKYFIYLLFDYEIYFEIIQLIQGKVIYDKIVPLHINKDQN